MIVKQEVIKVKQKLKDSGKYNVQLFDVER